MNGLAYPARLFGRAERALSRARVRWSLLDRVLTPGGAVAGLTLAFIGISWWWLTQDEQIPDSATGGHLITTLYYWDQLNAGHYFSWFTAFNVYPPLVHLVALGTFLVDGFSIEGPILVQNFIFLPLLASDRFERVGWSAAAGAAVGIGMMTKNTFIVVVAGLIAVALIRGGW